MIFNIKDYGAKADGVSNDAYAIQAAADACCEAGGGIIVIPDGEYVCSSVRLYSNTTVRIEQNARLYLCTDENEYGKLRGKYDTEYDRDGWKLLDLPENTRLNFMQKMFLAARRCHTDNMFYANNAENIVIEGDGILDGQYQCFFNSEIGSVEHIHMQNITAKKGGKDAAIFIAVQKEGRVRDVTVDGLDYRCKGAVTIQGTERETVSRLIFRNCHFYIEPTTKLFGNGMIDPLIQYWVSDLAPYNIYIRHAEDIRFIDCEVEWGQADIDDIWEVGDASKRPDIYNSLWREDMNPSDSWPCIDAFDTAGLEVVNLRGEGFGCADAVRTVECDNYKNI